MVFESNTLDFLWMQDGNQGSASGEGLYTWVKYSHNADGSNLSDDSTGMEYIGFAYNKTERIESENPSDYEWCKIKGDDGEPGTDGYTIILDNENISFTTSSLKIPLNDQTAVCKIIVYQGTEQRTNFLIGEITAPIGITIKVENKIIYLSASTSTAIGSLSGSIDIPIQIDGIDFHKKISYSLALKGEDGDSPVSVYLSNENHTFSATSNGKAITSRIQTNVYAYYGSTLVAATVGNLIPPTGMKIDIVNNGQTNTFLNISVDSTLDKNGVLDIPVTVGENIYHCSFCYTLSPQGADGTPAKAIDITPSSQVFKSTDGGTTFSPDKITITPRIQGDIEYSKWKYSTDGGETWTDITESTNGVSISSTILSIAKSSTLYTETITSIVFKCISNDSSFYDTCTISKIYDVVDFKDSVDAQFKETKETIAGVEQKVDKVNKSITDKVWQSDITTTLNNYDNTTVKDVRDRTTTVEKNLQGITSTVKDMQTTVKEKADGSTVTELTNRVSNVEQDVSGFKQTVESTYAKQDDLANVNKYAKSSFEQLSDKFNWIVKSNSSETSLTLTDSLISAITKQFVIKDSSGSTTIIEGGKIKANSITTNMLSSSAIKSNNYKANSNNTFSSVGTFLDLSNGVFHSPGLYIDSFGNASYKGSITATSLTLGDSVSISNSKISGLSKIATSGDYNDLLKNKPDLTVYISKDSKIGTVEEGSIGFTVSSQGLLQASNAIIYGTIYASSGKIGSFISDSTYLQSADKTVGLSPTASDRAFWAGGTNTNNAKFRVNHAGVLYATGANISGNITATSGTIGGCSISNGNLIVPSVNISGTLNASQIAANAITSDKISVSQLSAISANLGTITGGSINIGSGKFIVDSNGNFIATNGSLTGTVNATTMRAKQSISVYNDTFATYQDVVKWDGSNLSIGLVGNAGSTGVKGAQMAFSGSQISVGNSSIVCGSISGTNSSFTNVWVENFTNASTFKENITCNKNLKGKGDLTFADYQQDTLATASEVVYRRPIASAASNNSRVAFLQGASGNKISIRAQYGKSAFSSATFTASSSDIRLKEDIKDSSVNALSKIIQMQIREFNWKQTGVHQELGCVADELELIDPLLTVGGGYDKDGTMNIKSIDTLLLTEYAIKGIQELYSQNIQQQQRIEYLESQLNNR